MLIWRADAFDPMINVPRRSFLQIVLSIFPLSLFAAPSSQRVAQRNVGAVRAGEDRAPRGPVTNTTFKVTSADTAGAMFVMERAHNRKGGPDRHLHHDQDELFYVLEGEYVFEVGSERMELKTGDCVLGPRGISHAYAFVGATQGRLLISYSPAGNMEGFFRQFSAQRPAPTGPEDAAARREKSYSDYGMKYLGPPLAVE